MKNFHLGLNLEGYLVAWALFCCICILILGFEFKTMIQIYKVYFCFLFVPWKLVSFLISSVILIGVVPIMHDRSWDYIDASFMSVLTFLTSPWSIGVIFRSFKHNTPRNHVVLAVCIMCFSASWSYDLYNYIKDGTKIESVSFAFGRNPDHFSIYSTPHDFLPGPL
ncbi:MAG: hypothetical protein ABI041_02855 [Bdellovibrionia bacterium]